LINEYAIFREKRDEEIFRLFLNINTWIKSLFNYMKHHNPEIHNSKKLLSDRAKFKEIISLQNFKFENFEIASKSL